MEYTMEYVNEISQSDEVIEVDGAKVVIAPTAQMFLFGTEIDYERGLLESGFKFTNPNVSETCGCGRSLLSLMSNELNISAETSTKSSLPIGK